MRRSIRLIIISGIAIGNVRARLITADSERGERLFHSEGCIQCHSIAGEGGNAAPDLGKRLARNYSPALMASVMWNHAPMMWAAMRRRGIETSRLTEQQAADLFGYFYSVRFFDKMGDAGRGKQLLSSKHCAECHGIYTPKADGAKPVSKWESVGDPIALAEAMWNHSANMRQAFASQKIHWPELTGQNLTDILVYVRNVPAKRQFTTRFAARTNGDGEALFRSKGCIRCHTGKLDLAPRLKDKTLTDITAAMWNHAPKMAQPPPNLDHGEMRRIVSYLWAQQVLQDHGHPEDGKKVFAAKNCATCHNDPASGAPSLARHEVAFSAISLVSTLWWHGPRMLDEMRAKNLEWPRFTARQMSDLIAYMNTRK
jgi:mono/diheme cytochrome c family protein